MKTKLLAAVATFAFVATGVAYAQDNPRKDERPAAERTQMQAPAGAHKQDAVPRAAQMENRKEPMKGDAKQGETREAPKAAETEKRMDNKGEPKAAQNERKDMPKGEADKTRGAQAEPAKERKENAKGSDNDAKRMAEPATGHERSPAARTGENQTDHNGQRSARGEEGRGPVRVMGKIKMSNEHATRVSEELRRDGHSERVNVEIRVGERIPDRVEIRPLPEDVIALAPEYRGYDYFIDNDDEIVFVSPESHEIVGTIDYEGRAASVDETNVSAARPCPTEN